MQKGWHIVFTEDGRVRVFNVGIEDREQAVRAVLPKDVRRIVRGIVASPLLPVERQVLQEGAVVEVR